MGASSNISDSIHSFLQVICWIPNKHTREWAATLWCVWCTNKFCLSSVLLLLQFGNWSYFFNIFWDHNVKRVMLHMRSLRKIIPLCLLLIIITMLGGWQYMSATCLLCRKVPFNPCRISQRNFLIQKSKHKFSALAHGQVHEQLNHVNAIAKGDGSIIKVLMD